MTQPAYGAPEIRYNDRDVREDPSLHDLAVAYVRVYGGEFDPLVAAKNELTLNGTLNTATARVVLNCMRYDVNVSASLPAPQRPAFDLLAERREPSAIRRNGRKRRNFEPDPDVPCARTESHYSHSWQMEEDCDYVHCPGIPYVINRDWYELPAKVKKPYVASRTGLIHRTTGEAVFGWFPNRHDCGFCIPPVLRVKAACTETTRWLKQPLLFDKIPVEETEWRSRCKQGCFPRER
jgi:hypothetical protein